MSNFLWLDTSGPHCSVGLRVGEQDFCAVRRLDRSHNQHLLAMLDELFSRAGLRPVELNGIGFACGPGSFTGVRMGAACVQAIAAAADCSIVPVTTSCALFKSVSNLSPKAQMVAAIKSRGAAYYVALRQSLDSIGADEQHLLDEPSDWLTTVCASRNVHLVGSKPDWWPSMDMQVSAETSDPAALVAFVAEEIVAGRGCPAHDALPVYFSGDSPWVKAADRAKMAARE